MISHPYLGQVVQLWYRAALRGVAPHHGKVGTVVVKALGRPRNHGVEVDGVLTIVPAGHLREPRS